jgi:class 3 adenylate cyclase/tetratricopeptide (TPR) repeat protein/ribosomal protein L40E
MECPKCHFENPVGMQFCGKCGAKLEKTCPKCNFLNPSDFTFCGKCGHNLTLPSEPTPRPTPKDLSIDEKLDKIQRYLPGGLTEKILGQRGKIEGERKQVTVMFCDMEGFTNLSERLGPEETYSIMDQVYEILIHKVHDYEGTVNEMTGDGIVALFGAPIALEDAPQRAIRSAYAIHREVIRFSEKMNEERAGIQPIKMRIGIHTGPVVVGTLGNDLRVEFKAVGDTVNLASRMEELAEPGTTYVTEETFNLTEGLFRFEALGEKEVKGKEEPVKIYRVIALSTRRTRFDVSADRGLTPFVGRERELELLLDGFARSKGGRGQAFSIVSDAGVGKSRLLYEFRKAVANEDVTFLEGRCLSYSRGVAYHLHIDILKANFDIREGHGDSEIREKVKRGLKILRADEAATLPYLLELLSVKDSGIDKIPMSTEARKDRIIEALKRIALKGSEIRPLILAYEDLHWVDKSSEDVLKYLLESMPGARVFLIFTYRPEFVHTWGGRSYHSQVNLNRLSNRESLAMAAHLLGTEDIERNLEEFILEKTEGVPFFIEEFIKSLKELKIIEKKDNKYYLAKDIQAVTIPSTIQDVIMARVDSLPEGAKKVLQIGSVIEREFGHNLIKLVTGLPEKELLSHLSILKDSEFVYERGVYPQSTYIFKHALTREVVYDSILTKRKKKLHKEIGNAIEQLYRENIEEHFGVLIEHYIMSENYKKAAEYSRIARKKSVITGSVNDAIPHAKNAVECLEKLPRSDEVLKEIIDARTVLAFHYTQMNYHVEAKETLDPITDLALEADCRKRLPQILYMIGNYYCVVEEDFAEGHKHLKQAMEIAEEQNDVVSLTQAMFWLGVSLSLICEFGKGLRYLEKALSISTAANSLWGISVTKSNMAFFIYYFQGRVDSAFETSYEAMRIAEESDDIYSKTMVYTSHGTSCYGRGLLEEAKEILLKGIHFSEKINYLYLNATNNYFLGEIYSEIGDYQIAKSHYEKAVSVMEHARLLPSWVNLCKMALGTAKVMNREKDIHLESMYVYIAENKENMCEGCMRRYMGQILLNINDQRIPEAEDWIRQAIEADKRNGMMFHLGKDYALYSELFKRKGDQAKAEENLVKAIEIYRECGADGWATKAEEKPPTLL